MADERNRVITQAHRASVQRAIAPQVQCLRKDLVEEQLLNGICREFVGVSDYPRTFETHEERRFLEELQ